jgi:hypothetical protein
MHSDFLCYDLRAHCVHCAHVCVCERAETGGEDGSVLSYDESAWNTDYYVDRSTDNSRYGKAHGNIGGVARHATRAPPAMDASMDNIVDEVKALLGLHDISNTSAARAGGEGEGKGEGDGVGGSDGDDGGDAHHEHRHSLLLGDLVAQQSPRPPSPTYPLSSSKIRPRMLAAQVKKDQDTGRVLTRAWLCVHSRVTVLY